MRLLFQEEATSLRVVLEDEEEEVPEEEVPEEELVVTEDVKLNTY
jgi:hypothetical protein